MSIWKLTKDAIVASRLADERLHALAVQEIESGIRRDGLWAKAILQVGSDEIKVKLAYLRLLVKHLKDEHYAAERDQEVRKNQKQASASASTATEDGNDRSKLHAQVDVLHHARARWNQSDHAKLLALCKKLRSDSFYYLDYQTLAQSVGASFKSEGFLTGNYTVVFEDKMATFDAFAALKPWFISHIVPIIEGQPEHS